MRHRGRDGGVEGCAPTGEPWLDWGKFFNKVAVCVCVLFVWGLPCVYIYIYICIYIVPTEGVELSHRSLNPHSGDTWSQRRSWAVRMDEATKRFRRRIPPRTHKFLPEDEFRR